MTLAASFAGIPITLPGWTETVSYIFLGLLTLAIATFIWRTILVQKDRTQIDEIHAKTNMMLLILRSWQQDGDTTEVSNEHYAPDLVDPNEVTADHGSGFNK